MPAPTISPEGTVVMPGPGKDRTADDIVKRLTELRNEFTDVTPERRASDEFKAMIEEVKTLDADLTAVLAIERRDQAKVVATQGVGGQREPRGFNAVVESPEFRAWVDRGCPTPPVPPGKSRSENPGLYVETRAGIDEWGATGPSTTFPNQYDSTGAGMLLPVAQPIAPIPRQAKLYLRDLIPKMTTQVPQIPYVRELAPTESELAASAVAEGNTKPSASPNMQGAIAYVTTLATTMTLSKQLFTDSPALVQYVNIRLPYLVKFKEDWEFLQGSGTYPDIEGILNTPGLQTQAALGAGATYYAQSIGMGFADVELADGAPTAVVLNPTNAWAMFTARAAGGSGTFDAGTPFNALPLTVWGVPSYRTRAKPAGSALVADFQRGAIIADREQVNVAIYSERYAEQNLVLLLCEERVGLLVPRPDLFVEVTLS